MSHPAQFDGSCDHDDGLLHDHPWHSGREATLACGPQAADTSMLTTPSSALHDDAHYA